MDARDIRILKTIGVIDDAASGMQLELNIVSINGGEIRYDLREWSLDHDRVGQGVTFTNDGASVLLAFLKECFKDGGEGITLDSIHVPYTNLFGDPIVEPEKPKVDTKVCDLLREAHIDYVDKRSNKGSLWVTGGHELDPVMVRLGEAGYKFQFTEKGGKQTGHNPGWYLRTAKNNK